MSFFEDVWGGVKDVYNPIAHGVESQYNRITKVEDAAVNAAQGVGNGIQGLGNLLDGNGNTLVYLGIGIVAIIVLNKVL
jgi:hypothetical protein